MGARLTNNLRQTNKGHTDAFPALDIRALRKFGAFNEGQFTQCSFRHAGLSHVVSVTVDLRFEYNLKVVVGHGDSNSDIQVLGLTQRPTGFNGRRWYFVSEKGERAEKLYLVDGRFRTRKEARLTYRSQSMGKLDRVLEDRRKLEARLKGTRARGPARGRRRKQAEAKLEEIGHLLTGFATGIVRQDQNKRARARRREKRFKTTLCDLSARRAVNASRQNACREHEFAFGSDLITSKA